MKRLAHYSQSNKNPMTKEIMKPTKTVTNTTLAGFVIIKVPTCSLAGVAMLGAHV
jgi:hypothetical protein